MLNKIVISALLGGVALIALQPALATYVASAATPSPTNTDSLEVNPELYDLAGAGHSAGDLNDLNYKLALSHTFRYLSVGNAWKDTGNDAGLVQDKYNIALGYKYSF